MPRQNPYIIPIENKKPFETVYELKTENKIPTYEEFMKSYEGDVNYADLESGDMGEMGGCGPCADGRSANGCHCSCEELLRQRNTVITNINIYSNIQQIINIRFSSTGRTFKLRLIIENQGGYSRSKGYDGVEEAIRSLLELFRDKTSLMST